MVEKLERRLSTFLATRPVGPIARLLPRRYLARQLIERIAREELSMISRARLWSTYEICSRASLPAGAFVECGVGRGGCLMLMAFVARGARPVWGFDSFEGMPPLSEEDAGEGRDWVGYRCSGPAGFQGASDMLARHGLSRPWIRLVPGWFEESLPPRVREIGPIAVLRLDNDWYRSTRFCLETLYDGVVPGGAVIVDDYHTFIGCRKAIDEFRAARGIRSSMVTAEFGTEAHWFKQE